MRLINLFEAMEGKWLTADEVRGKPDLAQQEAFRQINYAWNEYQKRSDELRKTTNDALVKAGFRVDVFPDSKAEQNRYFETLEATGISMATYDEAKEEIAKVLPAVVVGRQQQPEAKPGEPIRISISAALFAVDEMWPHYEPGWQAKAKDWKPSNSSVKSVAQITKEFGSEEPTPVAPDFGGETASTAPSKEFGDNAPSDKQTPGASSFDWKKM